MRRAMPPASATCRRLFFCASKSSRLRRCARIELWKNPNALIASHHRFAKIFYAPRGVPCTCPVHRSLPRKTPTIFVSRGVLNGAFGGLAVPLWRASWSLFSSLENAILGGRASARKTDAGVPRPGSAARQSGGCEGLEPAPGRPSITRAKRTSESGATLSRTI